MNLKKIVILSGLTIVMMTTAQIVFAEEAAVTPEDYTVVTSNQQDALQKESDIQWAWGEVTNLDNQAKTVTLKYLDYETDQEKELVLVVDEKTTLENIQDFNELKLKDTLSIDYVVEADNKNIAKNISLEKPEVSPSALTPEVENNELITTSSNIVQPTAQSGVPAGSSVAANEAPATASATPGPIPATQDQAQ